jgi:hypothetical protein
MTREPGEQHPLLERLGYHAARLRAWARRAAPAALLVRGVVWLTGAAALLVAAPETVPSGAAAVAAVAVAGAAGAWPGTGWVSGLALGAVGLVALSIGQGDHRGGGAVALAAAVAALLYLHHTAAATAAHLRTDALVTPVVLRQWAGRTAAVLAGSAVIGTGVVLLPEAAPAWPATWLVVLGALAACVVAATLVRLARGH